MTAPFKPDQQSMNTFAAMSGQVEKWRGECIQHFAELQQIIEDLLRLLSGVPVHGSKVRLGQHVGNAFKQLRELTDAKGPFASPGKAISETLAEIAPWFEWRAHLTHGVLTVWRGRNDKWLIAFAHRPIGEDVVRTYALTWEEARNMQKLLKERIAAARDDALSLVKAD